MFVNIVFLWEGGGCLKVKVIKKINNNVALAINTNLQEVFIVGKGVGFKEIPYELPDDSDLIEQIFVAVEKSKYSAMFQQIPTEIILLSKKVIDDAEEALGKKLHARLLLTLSDHIHYTLERYKENIEIKNMINFEIKHIYPKEYKIALESVDFINKKLNIELPSSEAAFITVHYVNAQMTSGVTPRVSLTDILSDITTLVKYQFKIDIEKDQINYERFVAHIRMLIERHLAKTESVEENRHLYEVAKGKYPEEAQCVDRITELLKKNYKLENNVDEKLYLLLHIRRLTQRSII